MGVCPWGNKESSHQSCGQVGPSLLQSRTHSWLLHNEKVAGSLLLFIFHKNRDGRCRLYFYGADDGIRVFEPLAITELQVVEKISAHSHATYSSFARKSDVYNPVSFCYCRSGADVNQRSLPYGNADIVAETVMYNESRTCNQTTYTVMYYFIVIGITPY